MAIRKSFLLKARKDTVRYNTFRRCMGTVSLRHGDGSVVHDNYFLGEGKAGTGGVRLYARNHKIYNNYFESLTGSTWDAAITLTNGDTDTGSLSSHWRIDNVIISHNTMVDNYSNIEIGYAKADNSWKKEPRNVTMANNLVVGSAADLIKIYTTPTAFIWSGNIMYPKNGFELGMEASEDEIKQIDPLLSYEDSLWLLSSNSPAIDAALNSYINILADFQGQQREGINDVGADEYSATQIKRLPLNPENVGPDANDNISYVSNTKNQPASFLLFRNYPNPFNPTTSLEYFLQNPSNVRIEIYNVLGQKVATLLDERKIAGLHEILWNAEDLSTGIYIAVLKTNTGSKKTEIDFIAIIPARVQTFTQSLNPG